MKHGLAPGRLPPQEVVMDWVDPEAATQVRSREALRFAYVDEQGWDLSCGYAALATLLRRYRGVEVDEQALLGASAAGEHDVVKVSLAGLLRLARARGFDAVAGRTTYEGLVTRLTRSAPLLVHYHRPDGHFALVLAAGQSGVVTADPARGLELLTREQFLGRWSGVVLDVPDPRTGPPAALLQALRSVAGRAALVDRALSKGPPKR